MKLLLLSCLLAFAFAAPSDTNEKKRDIYSVEPVGEVVEDIVHDVVREGLVREHEEILDREIMDDVLFRRLVDDMPVLDREYLEFIERIRTGLPMIDRDVVPVDTVLDKVHESEEMDLPIRDKVRFLWVLDSLLSNPEWREYLTIMNTDTGFLKNDVERFNLESFIRDHSLLFEHYPFFEDIIRHFPRLLH